MRAVGVVATRMRAQKLVLAVCAATLSIPTTVAVAATTRGATGGLSFLPASGSAEWPLTAVSTGVCSDPRGTNLQLQVKGKGFPAGTNVTPNLAAHVYPVDPSTGGYDVPLQDTLQHFAAQQHPPAILSGRYDFTLVCKKPWGNGVYNTYRGSLWFSSATHYHTLTVSAAPTTTPAAATPSPRTSSPTPVTRTASATTTVAVQIPAPATKSERRTQSPTTLAPTVTTGQPTSAGRVSPPTNTTPAPLATRTTTRASATAAPIASPSHAATTKQPALATGASHGRASNSGWVAALLAGSVAVVAGLGLLVRRRIGRYGRQ